MAVKRKRRTRKRTTKRRRVARFRRMPTVVPDSKIVKHRWVSTIQLDAGISSSARHIYRANSMFDPDLTGVGTQPLGFDQWAVFYDHYTVIGSRLTAKFMPTSSSGFVGAAIVGVILTDNTSVLPTPAAIMEQNNSKWKLMGATGTQRVTTVAENYSPRKFFGIKDIGDNRALLGAQMNANPPEDAFFSVYTTGIAGGIDPAPVQVVITMEFTVKYTERKTLAAS